MSEKHTDDLAEIRNMMERSSRFISLSGLAGVVAGLAALQTSVGVYFMFYNYGINYFDGKRNVYPAELTNRLLVYASITLIVALAAGIFFTVRKSKQNQLPIWTRTTKQLLIALFIPLVAGGIFCLALLYHGSFYLIAPATLVFYGLALINAGKYTYGDIKNLGICEIILGLISMFVVGYGLIFWAIGFGILHIVYGIVMYKKYDVV